MLSTLSVNFFTPRLKTIFLLLKAFFVMLKAHSTLVLLSIYLQILVPYLLTQMQIGLVALILAAQPLATLFILEATWFLGVPKSNLLSLAPVMNLNIILWRLSLLNFFGALIFSMTSKFQFRSSLSCYVTTRVPFS